LSPASLELPWVEEHQSGCDCFSYLRLMNNWGADRCVSERDRIVGWFLGVAIYWIKPFTMAEATVPKYVRHVSQQRFKGWNPRNTWGKTRAHAYRWLLDHNYPTYDFAAHLPQPIESGKFLETEREVQMMTTRYRNWECVYLNRHHAAEAEDWGRRYLRVTRKRDSIQTRHKLLNHTHSQFRGVVENLLASLFPNPSTVEK
jgi:hypothetical protein